jgi:hypothetical protein
MISAQVTIILPVDILAIISASFRDGLANSIKTWSTCRLHAQQKIDVEEQRLMSSRKKVLSAKLIPVLALLTLAIPAAFCQLNSNTASVALRATLGESLTVAATPSTVAIPLVSGGTAIGTSPVAITTTWVLSASRTAVTLVGYFSSATVALTNGASTPANIPSSEVLGQMTTGTPTAFTAFTQTSPLGAAGAGLILFSQALSGTNRTSNRTDNLNLEINLAAQPQLPAGAYTGTLNIQAQAL